MKNRIESILREIAQSISENCDGAYMKDYVGFNRIDARIIPLLLSKPSLSESDLLYLATALIKYKGQIDNSSYQMLLKIKRDLDIAIGLRKIENNKNLQLVFQEGAIFIAVEGAHVFINTPYNRKFVEACRDPIIKWRWFDRDTKMNKFSVDDKEGLEFIIQKLKSIFSLNSLNVSEVLNLIYSIYKSHSFGTLEIENNKIFLFTEYNRTLVSLIHKIRALKGVSAIFRKDPMPQWIFEVDIQNAEIELDKFIDYMVEIITKFNLSMEPELFTKFIKDLEGFYERISEKIKLSHSASIDPKEYDAIGLKFENGYDLYPFQKVSVLFFKKIYENEGYHSILIADEMGLGKTVQAIAIVQYLSKQLKKKLKVLVICPAVVKLNWKYEIKRFVNEPSSILAGKKKRKGNVLESFIDIINYDVLTAWEPVLINKKYDVVILDEAHYIKNPKAKRSISALAISRSAEFKILLTGTPIMNQPGELWNLLEIMGIEDKFAKSRNDLIYNVLKKNSLEYLQTRLRSTCMIRRLKEDVLKELPEKQVSYVPMELMNEEEYLRKEEEVIEEIKKRIKEGERTNILAEIERLRQIAIGQKLESMIKYIKMILESKKKIVIFAHHRELQQFLVDKLKCLWLRSGLNEQKRMDIINDFNQSGDKSIVVSLHSGGTGINLQSTNIAIFCELDWVPANLVQAEDRIHRIGQKDIVNIYYLIAKNTIEDRLYRIIQEKREIAERTLNFNVLKDSILDSKNIKDILLKLKIK